MMGGRWGLDVTWQVKASCRCCLQGIQLGRRRRSREREREKIIVGYC